MKYRFHSPVGTTLAALTAGTLLAGCAGAGAAGSAGGDNNISVLMVGNPQMEDIAALTADHFTADTGINVNFTILPENEARDKATQDIATEGGQYDVATIGAYEAPIWGDIGWLHDLQGRAAADDSYRYEDLLTPMVDSLSDEDGKLYAAPFYGESSFLMYNKELFAQEGLEMPDNPTWPEVAELAATMDESSADVSGICLRGLPGWGEMFAPLTTVVNTFGGTWFEEDWTPKVNGEGFTKAVEFYVDLVREHGQAGASQSGFTECLNTFGQGKAAIWYDATSAAGSLEDPEVSEVAGDVGYVPAPVVNTTSASWLWSWAFAMPRTTTKEDSAWEFIRWATSAEYEQLAGEELGWTRVPSGTRESTYANADYHDAAASFADITLESIQTADPHDPGVQPRPAQGVQFVGIPEFSDLGTKVSQEIAAAIAGDITVKEALNNGQKQAEEVADAYRD